MEFWAPRVFYKHKELEKEIERREGERREVRWEMIDPEPLGAGAVRLRRGQGRVQGVVGQVWVLTGRGGAKERKWVRMVLGGLIWRLAVSGSVP